MTDESPVDVPIIPTMPSIAEHVLLDLDHLIDRDLPDEFFDQDVFDQDRSDYPGWVLYSTVSSRFLSPVFESAELLALWCYRYYDHLNTPLELWLSWLGDWPTEVLREGAWTERNGWDCLDHWVNWARTQGRTRAEFLLAHEARRSWRGRSTLDQTPDHPVEWRPSVTHFWVGLASVLLLDSERRRPDDYTEVICTRDGHLVRLWFSALVKSQT